MGILKDLNDLSNRNKKRKQDRAKQVNQNPTEEQLKDNKNGKLAYVWTFISIIVYLLGFGAVATAWESNIALGIFALLFVLVLTPIPHKKAIEYAKEQRKINGKGLMALIVATLLPAALLAGGFFFFVFGGMYFFK